VGPYRVLFRLANGASSSVYLCREAEHGSVRSLFALKLFDPAVEVPEMLPAFAVAAEAAGELIHPNLLRLLGTGSFEGRPLVVSEYVDGCSLAALLKRHPNERPPRLIVALMFDALRGLQAAHELGNQGGAPALIHGDLGPRDLLLGLDGICKVSDLAPSAGMRAIRPLALSADPLKLAYLSPERLLGRKVDARADVFSLGVILYEALTGVELFTAPTVDAVRARVLDEPIEAPSRVGLRAPEPFDAVCLRALQRDPDERYASAREMLLALEEAALTHDTLASSIEVADWIRAAFGRELELRRLSILDASRRSRSPRAPSSVPPPPVREGTGDADVPSAAALSHTLPSAYFPSSPPSNTSTALAVVPKPRALALAVEPEFEAAPPSLRLPPSRLGLVAGVCAAVGLALVTGWLLARNSGQQPEQTAGSPLEPATPALVSPAPGPEVVPQAPAAQVPEPAAASTSAGRGATDAAAGEERAASASAPPRRAARSGTYRAPAPSPVPPPPPEAPTAELSPPATQTESAVPEPPKEQPAGDNPPAEQPAERADPDFRYGI
jgi:serine/threonine-protein kinase